MPDRLDVHAFRSPAKLPGGEEEQRRIRSMVYDVSKDDDAPFERMIDYWFAAISWAVHHGIEPPQDDSDGKMFVEIGRQSNFIMLEPWRIEVLTVLYILGQSAFLVDPFDSSKINTTAGRLNEHANPVGASEVIRNANRYAIAGAMPMWEAFVGGNVDATRAPKQVAAANKLLEIAQHSGKKFRATFASFGDRPRDAATD
jgi:hypothetical protein